VYCIISLNNLFSSIKTHYHIENQSIQPTMKTDFPPYCYQYQTEGGNNMVEG
jgi:hypothetical protein